MITIKATNSIIDNTTIVKKPITLKQLYDLLSNAGDANEITISMCGTSLQITKLPNGKYKYQTEGDIPRISRFFPWARKFTIVFGEYLLDD